MTDEEKIERIARELCRAAGQDPDAKVRLGPPLSFAAGECTIVKPLIVPAWKAYCREARRLSMSDAEHTERSARARKPRRRRLILRLRASARMLRSALRRRFGRAQFAAGLHTLRAATGKSILAWPGRSRARATILMPDERELAGLPVRITATAQSRRLFASRRAYRAATRARWRRGS